MVLLVDRALLMLVGLSLVLLLDRALLMLVDLALVQLVDLALLMLEDLVVHPALGLLVELVGRAGIGGLGDEAQREDPQEVPLLLLPPPPGGWTGMWKWVAE